MQTPEAQRSADLVHPPVADPRWRESYYFSFFDPALGIGGFTSLGKRPARSHTGSINVIWGPEIPTLVAAELDELPEHDDRHSVAGLSYEPLEPFGAWRLRFRGPLNDGGLDVDCLPEALGSAHGAGGVRRTQVSYDLVFTPRAAPYQYHERPEWRDLFDGHIDEVGIVEGELVIGGARHAVHGRGAKDHSWGVRDWVKPSAWRWVDLVAPGSPELTLWRARFEDGWVGDGALYPDGRAARLTRYREEIETADADRGKALPVAIDLVAEGEDGAELRASGRTLRVVPTLFRSRRLPGATAWNDRALMECALPGGGQGWANVEFEELVVEERVVEERE